MSGYEAPIGGQPPQISALSRSRPGGELQSNDPAPEVVPGHQLAGTGRVSDRQDVRAHMIRIEGRDGSDRIRSGRWVVHYDDLVSIGESVEISLADGGEGITTWAAVAGADRRTEKRAGPRPVNTLYRTDVCAAPRFDSSV